MKGTLNPDNLRNDIRIAITNHLNDALAELPGRWPIGCRRFLFFSHRKRVAETLTEAIWPLVTDAALGIAQCVAEQPAECRGEGKAAP